MVRRRRGDQCQHEAPQHVAPAFTLAHPRPGEIGAAGDHDHGDGADEATAIAKSYCSEAFFQAAGDNIQIHGGMGFTWEHPAHLYFKRAKSSSLLFGDPVKHREKLAARIGL